MSSLQAHREIRPKDTDRKYYINGVFDEDTFTREHFEWEEQESEILRRESDERIALEKEVIAKAKEFVKADHPTFVPAPTYVPAPTPSKTRLTEASNTIINYISSTENDVKSHSYAELEKLIKPVSAEVDKIRIHCDYKEKIQLTTAEEKKIETLRGLISSTDLSISKNQTLVEKSTNKVERIEFQIEALNKKHEDELERLRLEYEAKIKALETKHKTAIEKMEQDKRTSLNYIQTVKQDIARFEANKEQHIAKINEKIHPKVKLTMTDYTKLRQIKTRQLEHCQVKLDEWYNFHKSMDDTLEQELETFHGREIHKIDEDDLNGVQWLRDKYDYEGLYIRLGRTIHKHLREINELLDHSEADED